MVRTKERDVVRDAILDMLRKHILIQEIMLLTGRKYDTIQAIAREAHLMIVGQRTPLRGSVWRYHDARATVRIYRVRQKDVWGEYLNDEFQVDPDLETTHIRLVGDGLMPEGWKRVCGPMNVNIQPISNSNKRWG
jgi:hypothetical protein